MRDSGKCATPKCRSLAEGFALCFASLLTRFLERSISGIRNWQGWTQLRKETLVPEINWEKRRLHKLSNPWQKSLHTLGTCTPHQSSLCEPGLYVLHLSQHLWEALMQKPQPSLSEQRITLHAAPTSKQRRSIYIHVLRKKGRRRSCAVQIVRGGEY